MQTKFTTAQAAKPHHNQQVGNAQSSWDSTAMGRAVAQVFYPEYRGGFKAHPILLTFAALRAELEQDHG